MTDVNQIKEEVRRQAEKIDRVRSEIARVVVGQEYMVSRLLIGLLTGGHVLLEGVPGLAKTTTVKALADALETKFQRLQFTPDLLPADLIGTMIYRPSAGRFETKKGPIFANFILADEINRAPSKVQSALLEAMQEKQVTIGDATFPLDDLFLVMATQNPIEQEGTYPLPEAQVDRFMLKLKIGYPTADEERRILDRALDSVGTVIRAAMTRDEVLHAQEVVGQVYIDESVRGYILDLVQATRRPEDYRLAKLRPLIEFGASPRAGIFLGKGARAVAALAGRGFVTPQDVKDIVCDVLRHRVLLTYEAEAESVTAEDVIGEILSTVPVP